MDGRVPVSSAAYTISARGRKATIVRALRLDGPPSEASAVKLGIVMSVSDGSGLTMSSHPNPKSWRSTAIKGNLWRTVRVQLTSLAFHGHCPCGGLQRRHLPAASRSQHTRPS